MDDPLSKLWRNWLLSGAAFGVGSGLFLVGAAFSDSASQQILESVFALNPSLGGPITGGARQALAVSGALTAAWGVIAGLLAPGTASTPEGDRRAGRALAAGVIAWFTIDSTASIALGAAMNVVGNVLFLIALLPPALVMARRRLH